MVQTWHFPEAIEIQIYQKFQSLVFVASTIFEILKTISYVGKNVSIGLAK